MDASLQAADHDGGWRRHGLRRMGWLFARRPGDREGAGDGGDPSTSAPLDGGDARGTDADASAPPFCASQSPTPFFCADFEQLEGLDPAFTRLGGTVKVDRGMLLVRLPSISSQAPDGATTPAAYVRSVANAEALALSASVSVLVPALPPEASAKVLWIVVPINASVIHSSRVALVFGSTPTLVETTFERSASGSSIRPSFERAYPTARSLPVGAWTRVEMHLTLGTPPHATLTFGGELAWEGDLGGTWAPAGVATALVGLVDPRTPSEAWSASFDDWTFDLR